MMIRKVITLLLLSSSALMAQTSFTSKTTAVSVKGTSTMHDWTSKLNKSTFKGSFTITDGKLTKINDATFSVPAKGLKSTENSDLMDNRTYTTISADKYPNITFVYTKTNNLEVIGSETLANINGNLTIAGNTKPVDVVMKLKLLPSGDIQVIGSEKIKMSNFGIKPPTFLMGALKVGDELNIVFDLVLDKK